MIFFKLKKIVRLAIQLLSSSVADALNYREDNLHLQEFNGCQATVQFIYNISNCFDILYFLIVGR